LILIDLSLRGVSILDQCIGLFKFPNRVKECSGKQNLSIY